MKVRIEYGDGQYTANDWPRDVEVSHITRLDGKPFVLHRVDMPEEDWREYQNFLTEYNSWQKYLRELDNKQFALDHSEA